MQQLSRVDLLGGAAEWRRHELRGGVITLRGARVG